MVDLKSQHAHLKPEIDKAVHNVIDSSVFIKGQEVASFENELANYLGVKHVIGCGNGTDAIQIALMALDLEKGDEVIVPAFTYPAAIEVILLLGLKPIMVDIDIQSFNIDVRIDFASLKAGMMTIIFIKIIFRLQFRLFLHTQR
jgi:dTDP-4-amino-4,6-dideoxygalactose transaminase